MKKKFILICTFVFMFLFLPTLVNAKSITKGDITASFGNGDTLNLGYQAYDQFRLEKDNTFYYNGIKYTLSSEDKEKGYMDIGNDKLSYKLVDEKEYLISSITHEFYAFPLRLDIRNDKEYNFTQRICYKYNDVNECKIDSHDIIKVDKRVNGEPNLFFYGFLPFYDKDLKFTYLSYDLTLTNINDSNDVVEFNGLTFDTLKGDVISYSDYAEFKMVNWNSFDHIYNNVYNGKNYLSDYCLQFSFFSSELVGQVPCQDKMYLTLASKFYYDSSDYKSSEKVARNYLTEYEVLYGDNYSLSKKYNASELYSLVEVVNSNYMISYVLDNFNPYILNYKRSLVYLPLDFLEYDSKSRTTKYDSFKVVTRYTCFANDKYSCDDSRSVKDQEYVDTYYLNLDEFKNESVINNAIKIEGYNSYAYNNDFNIDIKVTDKNGIDKVYYLVSDTSIKFTNKDMYTVLNGYSFTQVENNSKINVVFDKSNKEAFKYVYLKVIDKAGRVDYAYLGELVFDINPPKMISNNFNDYDLSIEYGTVRLKLALEELLDLDPSLVKGYYLIVDESRKGKVSVEDVINANNQYHDEVVLNSANISKNGNYLVYFVFKDMLDNTSELIESNVYKLDVTPISKEDVEVSKVDNYVNELKVVIDIKELDENVSFKCDISKEVITNPNQLKNQCFNKKENTLSVNDEDIYYLWIYGVDKVGNLSLIKFDNPYYIDSIAPRVSSSVVKGNNNVYSNDVEIKVSAQDLNDIDSENSYYQFYLASYNQSKFTKFNLQDTIKYPFDYYGNYKLAIKVCDVVGNCKINTFPTSYLIDTSKILIKLNGDSKINILRFQDYNELGVQAYKNNQNYNKVNVSYSISGSVDNKTPGEYLLTYSAGEGINKVSITRTIIVKDSMPYIYTLIGLFLVGEAILIARLFIKKRKNDTI